MASPPGEIDLERWQREIGPRLVEVCDRIAQAARRAGRSAESVRLVAASKTKPALAIRAAYNLGLREVGENYVQEALAKQGELEDLADLRWHLFGHLQSNKARLAAGHFALIHTLDSVRLAAALARAVPKTRLKVLIEVNAGGEASKSGVAPDQVEPLLDKVRGELEVGGLMAIPPLTEHPAARRRYFVELRQLRDRLAKATGIELSELSMGMSDDYEIAIEEGATIVRVGRAIFGPR